MASFGFWRVAQDDPAHVAVVTADGEHISAGQLLASATAWFTACARWGYRVATPSPRW
jgi:hypothetical protein